MSKNGVGPFGHLNFQIFSVFLEPFMYLKPHSVAFTVFLASLTALSPLSIDMSLPALPEIEGAFPGAAHRGALTLSLFMVGLALSPPLIGVLADRFGRKPTLAASLLALCLSAAACAVAPTFDLLLLFRLFQGAAAGGCVIMPFAIVRDCFEGAEARSKLSHVAAVIGVAPAVAPALGSCVLAFFEWRMIFAAQALVALLLLFSTRAGFRETLDRNHVRPLRPKVLLDGYRTVLADAAFRNYTTAYAFGFACLFAYISASPTLLIVRLGLDRHVFSLLFAATACCLILGALSSAALHKRDVSFRRLLFWGGAGFSLGALSVFGVAMSGGASAATILPPVALMVYCFGLLASNVIHESMVSLPHLAGLASGVSRSTQMAMGAASSAVVSFLLPFGRVEIVMAAIMLTCAMVASGALIVQLCRRSRPEYKP